MATDTQQTSARQHQMELVHYARFPINWNDVGISATGGVGTGIWLPKGAIIVGTDTIAVTVFNAVTTNVVTVGTDASSLNMVASGDYDETQGSNTLTQNIKPTSAALGPLAADVQIMKKYTQTGTAATAGKAVVIVKYVVDNDVQPS